MLTINISGTEYWDEIHEEFITPVTGTLLLEHSLVSISKWEQKWKKPFLKDGEKRTPEEVMDYIRCMTLNKVDPNIYNYLTTKDIHEINKYIEDPATATWFTETPTGKRNSEIVTSELIYYWMTAYNIPASYQYWHLNRLITLIRICNVKNQPEKKRSKKELLERHRSINQMRRAQRAKAQGGST